MSSSVRMLHSPNTESSQAQNQRMYTMSFRHRQAAVTIVDIRMAGNEQLRRYSWTLLVFVRCRSSMISHSTLNAPLMQRLAVYSRR